MPELSQEEYDRLHVLRGRLDDVLSGVEPNPPPPPPPPSPPPIPPPPPGGATDIRTTGGVEVDGGGGMDGTNMARVAQTIKDMVRWTDDQHFWYRLQVGQAGNMWSYQADFTGAGRYGTTRVTQARCCVVWAKAGASNGRILLNGKATATIGPEETWETIQPKIDAVAGIGVGSMEVAGNMKDGLHLKPRGALIDVDVAFEVDGTLWDRRWVKYKQNSAIWLIQDGVNNMSYADKAGNINLMLGSNWQPGKWVYDAHRRTAEYLMNSKVKHIVCSLMHEAVTSRFGYFGFGEEGYPGESGYTYPTPENWAQAYRNVVDLWRQVRLEKGRTDMLLEWDYNLWVGAYQNPAACAVRWPRAYPGSSYIDYVSIDSYWGGGGPEKRDKTIVNITEYVEPFIRESGKKAAMSEYAWGNDRVGSYYDDNTWGYGTWLAQWWKHMCDDGLGGFVEYFDAPGSAPDDFTFLGRRNGRGLPASKQLFCETF